MGGLIGVLSTVILVSTVCTLIFAVGAYIVSRKGRNGVGALDEQAIPGNDVADQFPTVKTAETTPSVLFKRANAGAGATSEPTSGNDEEYLWK